MNNKKITETVAAAAEIPVYFVWQPIACYNYRPAENLFKQDLNNCFPGCAYMQMENYKTDLVKSGNTIWLADLSQNRKENLYVDQAHYSPILNKLVATEIATFIQSKKAKL